MTFKAKARRTRNLAAVVERRFEQAKSSYMPSIVRHEDAGWFDRAKNAERERDQLRLDMMAKHKIAKDLVKRHGDETCGLLAEIEAWKDASGLERGGDHDGVTPDDLRNELAHLRAAQEKSRGAADEALLAEHEAEMAKMVLTVGRFCRQCEYGDEPGSCPDCPLQLCGGASNE